MVSDHAFQAKAKTLGLNSGASNRYKRDSVLVRMGNSVLTLSRTRPGMAAAASTILIAGSIYYLVNTTDIEKSSHNFRAPISIEQVVDTPVASRYENRPKTQNIHISPLEIVDDIPKDEPRSLVDFVLEHFESMNTDAEKKAFKRVLEKEKSIEKIVKQYDRVDKNTALAIMKQETQGHDGFIRSKSGARGPFQITFFGAYSHLFYTLFSDDPMYAGERKEYSSQLSGLQEYLTKNGVLVKPGNNVSFKKAKQLTWKRLKDHFTADYDQTKFEKAAEMGILYLDHLAKEFDTIESLAEAYNLGPTASRERTENGISLEKYTEPFTYVKKVAEYKKVFDALDKARKDLFDASREYIFENARKFALAQKQQKLREQQPFDYASYRSDMRVNGPVELRK